MTSRRSTRGIAAPRDASALCLMWPRLDTRRKWLVLCCALSAWALEASLASAQSEKPKTASTEAKPGASDAANNGDAKSAEGKSEPSNPSTAADTQGAAVANEVKQEAADMNEGEVIGKLPVAEPPPEQKKPAATAQQPNMAGSVSSKEDVLDEPGYLPGYKRYFSLGQSPNAPPVAALPGGFTPGYGAPSPMQAWTFAFSGSANVSAQFSGMPRRDPAPGQSSFVLHSPPRTVEEWSSFTSSSTVPGNWVSLRFSYGTPKVAANVSVDTWNPTDPTSYYQLGSQSYINNAYLAFTPEPIGKLRLRVNAGQMTSSYGMLGKYGGGLYVNPLAATLKGIGESVFAEYDLTDTITLSAEQGFWTSRNGTPPAGYVTEASNGYTRQFWAGAFFNHAHLGVIFHGPYEVVAELHYIDAFFHDDRVQSAADNPQTPEIDESYVRDPSIRVYTADVRVSHDTWGQLGVGVTYLHANYSYPLSGLLTYGGDGSWLTDRWFGVTTTGTGKLLVAAFNYGVSIGRLAAYPNSFSGNGPDLVINTGLHWTKTWTEFAEYDGRVRWKGAIDGLYTFIRYMGIGLRVDHIVPNSYDSGETYNVVAPRLQFKTDWTSRETLSLLYGRWFYGPRTRNEGTGLRTPDRLDNNLFALNFNLWW